jgi:hypothetical protein
MPRFRTESRAPFSPSALKCNVSPDGGYSNVRSCRPADSGLGVEPRVLPGGARAAGAWSDLPRCEHGGYRIRRCGCLVAARHQGRPRLRGARGLQGVGSGRRGRVLRRRLGRRRDRQRCARSQNRLRAELLRGLRSSTLSGTTSKPCACSRVRCSFGAEDRVHFSARCAGPRAPFEG